MNEIKNVCLLNDSFPPVIDGVANAVYNYADILERKYAHAIVSTPYYPGAEDRYPFEVIRYDSLDTARLVGYRFGMPLSVSHLSEYKNKDIDILHCHCPVSSMILARVLRDELQKPIILHYHTKFDIDIKRAVDSKLIQTGLIKMLVENISYADEVWVVSKGAGANLRSLGYEGRYVVMRNGVDFEKGKADEKLIRKLKDDYHISDDKPVYLFVGRMMWYKGIRIILDALNTLKNEGRDYQMVFVGDGVEKKQIEDYVRVLGLEGKCIFTGAVRERDVLKGFYSLADLFLFPSTFDTNGIVVSEAAASGLASVLIKDSCAAEEVTDGRNAFLIEEESNSLTRTLLDLGNDKELFRTIGQNAMDDLYVSWEESVDNAYKRYQIVQREFSYQRPGLLDDRKLTESMITMMADLATGLDLVQRRNEEFENRVNAFLDRWL